MADLCDPFDGSDCDHRRPAPHPPRQLDTPLVAAVEPSHLGSFDQLDLHRVADEPVADTTRRRVPLINVEQELHGTFEQLDPAELRRAALLRMIGLGRLASRSSRPG